MTATDWIVFREEYFRQLVFIWYDLGSLLRAAGRPSSLGLSHFYVAFEQRHSLFLLWIIYLFKDVCRTNHFESQR